MRGIIPSLNTPFTQDGALDIPSLKKLVQHTINSGCAGMLGLAVAGEYETLSYKEKRTFIEVVANENNGTLPLIISVTSTNAESTLELSKLAKAHGATGICVQIYSDTKLSDNIAFLKNLSQHSPKIIMVQDLDWSGDGLDLDSILTMFNRVKKLTWLKIETKKAGPKYSAVKSMTNNHLKVCGGWAVTQLLDALDRQVDAFIPTGMEFLYTKIYKQYHLGNHDLARELFHKLLPVLNFSNQHIDISIRFLKELRVKEGIFSSSFCRNKRAIFDDTQAKEAKFLLKLAHDLSKEYA